MKKTIFIAMMLIGMMGSAQTINNPVIIKHGEHVNDKLWYMYNDDSSSVYYANTNKIHAISYAKILVAELSGELTKPDFIHEENDTAMYEWFITDTKVLALIVNDVSSLIVIKDFVD
jgi:hypothetical protein